MYGFLKGYSMFFSIFAGLAIVIGVIMIPAGLLTDKYDMSSFGLALIISGIVSMAASFFVYIIVQLAEDVRDMKKDVASIKEDLEDYIYE